MVINTNLQALQASTRLAQSSSMLAQSLARLSSGSKITSPADDSAGLAVSMKLNSQLARLDAVSTNLESAISFTQTQDGYMQKMEDAVARMSQLAVMARDVTKTDSDRSVYDIEFHTLAKDVQSITNKTFNGVSLFSANPLQVTTDDQANTFSMTGVDLGSMSYNNVLLDRVNVIGDNSYGAVFAQNDLQKVINALAKSRADLGSNLESLNYYHDQIAGLKNNLSAANSRITDVDVAQESTNYAHYNILTQAGTAMLAQANSLPQSVLKLLG